MEEDSEMRLGSDEDGEWEEYVTDEDADNSYSENDEDEEDEEEEWNIIGMFTQKKQRLWSKDNLHKRFVDAVKELERKGIKATSKDILEIMNDIGATGLKRRQVDNHLQRYRKGKCKWLDDNNSAGVIAINSGLRDFVPYSYKDGFRGAHKNQYRAYDGQWGLEQGAYDDWWGSEQGAYDDQWGLGLEQGAYDDRWGSEQGAYDNQWGLGLEQGAHDDWWGSEQEAYDDQRSLEQGVRSSVARGALENTSPNISQQHQQLNSSSDKPEYKPDDQFINYTKFDKDQQQEGIGASGNDESGSAKPPD